MSEVCLLKISCPNPFPSLLYAEPLTDRISDWDGDRWGEATILNSLARRRGYWESWLLSSSAASLDFEFKLAEMMGRTGSEAFIDAVDALPEILNDRVAESLEGQEEENSSY